MLGTEAACPVCSQALDHCPSSKWAGQSIHPQNSCSSFWLGVGAFLQLILQDSRLPGRAGQACGSWWWDRGSGGGKEAGSPVLSGSSRTVWPGFQGLYGHPVFAARGPLLRLQGPTQKPCSLGLLRKSSKKALVGCPPSSQEFVPTFTKTGLGQQEAWMGSSTPGKHDALALHLEQMPASL